MKKDITVFVRVYLKNRTVIEEAIVFINSNKDEVDGYLQIDIIKKIKMNFKQNIGGCITVNDTFIRADDISAIEIRMEESK